MQPDRFAPPPPDSPTVGTVTMVFAAVGCFAVGFMVLMAYPRLWPRYVPVPVSANAQTVGPMIVGQAPPRPAIVHEPAPGVLTAIKPSPVRPVPQPIGGTLASLAECKAALRTGAAYGGVAPEGMAALLGTRGQALTMTQIDAGCRRLTE